MMELRHLRYFLAVADSLSFTRAAATLHLTQPTLSQQIKQLEQGLGTVLFDRVGRSVRLTAGGTLFRQHAERALKEISSASAALGELEGLMHGTLTIGVFQSFNSSLLPPILASFSAAYPGIHVTVRQLPTGEMEERLVKGELDLGIAYVRAVAAKIATEELFDEAMTLVVGAQHPLAGLRAVTAKQLHDQPLVLLTSEFPSRTLLTQWFSEAGYEARIRMEIDSTDAILATVKCSALATIQTRRMASIMPDLRCIPLRPRLIRTAAILWRSEGYRSAAARVAAALIKQAYGRNTAVKAAAA
ncbi:MAG: transcriptional regulator CynR [Proteobacteria bacterium]|nr:transcriptional regulator CynR [Burkholderiales bacterium]